MLVLGVSAMASACGPGGTSQYPTKPVDLIVTFSPGGASDQTARIVADYLTKKWVQAVNVVNKPGGSGAVGVTAALTAPADGYTIMLHSFANTVVPAVQSDAPYKWDDLKAISMIQSSPDGFTVPADSPYKTLKEALEAAKANPEKFSYGVGGVASPAVLGFAKLFAAAGVDATRMRRVIFDGGGPTLTANAGGHVDFACQPMSEAVALVKAGKLRYLALASQKRMSDFPDVPTAKEAGYPDFDVSTWNGFSGPSKLPDAVVAKWADAVKQASQDAEIVKKFKNISSIVDYRDPAAFKKFWEDQYTTMRTIAEKQGLRK